MFSISDMVPASNILNQIQGVEEGLRKRRRIGTFGWVIFITGSAVQVLAEINNLGVLSIADIWSNNPWLASGLFATAFIIVASLLVAVWSTFWLTESKRPFRYTCNIGEFKPLAKSGDNESSDLDSKMKWLSLDLSRQLNDRVQRFNFVESDSFAGPEDTEGVAAEAHIHVHGHYVIRKALNSENYEIEVTPSIRIGPPGSPEVLAQTPPPTALSDGPSLTREVYDQLLEQIYHSVVSEVYQQLREDVQRKIDLLPTTRLKAIALLYEADDYARSNTLHAYDQATDLYYQAAKLIDPTLRLTPKSLIPKLIFVTKCWISIARRQIRYIESHFRPRVGETGVLRTRAIIGYARMLCFRRQLSSIVGAGTNEVFEAVRILEDADQSLNKLSKDVSGRDSVRFECFTTWALSLYSVDDYEDARKKLSKARELDPIRAEKDVVYLFADACISDDQRTRLTALRHAVELEPRFEVAQFFLAYEIELLWRSKDSFEPNVAKTVIGEYRKLLMINPGNLGAWSNAGYILWLLGGEHIKEAMIFFTQGRRFKEIKKDVYVSELEYGLARIYAERGEFEEAYNQYVASTSRMIAGQSFQDYYYKPMTPATLKRYQEYYLAFARHARKARAKDQQLQHVNQQERYRLRKSLHAFVLCDLGEAYTGAYFARNLPEADSGTQILNRAKTAMVTAIKHNPDYAYPHYLLGRMYSDDYLIAKKSLDQAVNLEPMWAEALNELVRVQSKAAPEAERELEQSRARQKDIESKLDKRQRLREKQKRPTFLVAQSNVSDSTRVASSAVGQQYNFKEDSSSDAASYGTARRLQQTTESSTQTTDQGLRDEISRLDQEIDKLNDDIKLHNSNERRHRETAQVYRRDARRLIRRLLPHEWLWNGEEFNWSALGNNRYKRDRRWEREFTTIHVDALYHWALRFVHDTNRSAEALRLLSHITSHFYPAHAGALENTLKLMLGQANLEYKKKLVETFSSKNHCVVDSITNLEEVGFSLTEEISLLSDAIKDKNVGMNINLKERLMERLANALQRKANESAEERTALDALEEALKVAVTPSLKASLHLEFAKRLTPTTEFSVLESAINHVSIHNDITGKESFELKKRPLENDRADLLRVIESTNLWGEAGQLFTSVSPPISVRLGGGLESLADLSEAEDDRSREQILSDLHWGMYWELGILFPDPVIEVDFQIKNRNRYYIDLEGVPLVTQELNLKNRLVNSTATDLAKEDIKAIATVSPANGAESAFVTEEDYISHKKLIDGLGYSWGPFSYLILHTAAILRKQALIFLRVDNVTELMRYHGLDKELDALIKNDKLLALTNVLRALVCEEISIIKLPKIVQLFNSQFDRCDNLTSLVESIRSHLNFRRNIPYLNRSYYKFVPLGPRFEAEIKKGLSNGKNRVLALSPEITQDLLSCVRDYITNLSPDFVSPIIMTKPGLRLWVRRLVELEFPHLPVLSEKEVLPEHLEDVKGLLDLA